MLCSYLRVIRFASLLRSVVLVESVLHVLDTYNDAAHRALYVLNQQYLYDEVPAQLKQSIDR